MYLTLYLFIFLLIASVNNNEISYNCRSGDRSNYYQQGISDGDDDAPEIDEGAFAEEAKKNGSNGMIVLLIKIIYAIHILYY